MSDTTITVTLPTDYVEFLNMFGALNHMTIQGALALIVKTRMDETRALTQRPAAQEVARFEAGCNVLEYLKQEGAPYRITSQMLIALHGDPEGRPAPQQATPDSACKVCQGTGDAPLVTKSESLCKACYGTAETLTQATPPTPKDVRIYDWITPPKVVVMSDSAEGNGGSARAEGRSLTRGEIERLMGLAPPIGFEVISHRVNDITFGAEARQVDENTVDIGRVVAFADERATPEPTVTFATVRDAEDELHIECRFSDGQKFAAVTVAQGFDNLAHRIETMLNGAQQATPEPSRGMIGMGSHALANELAQAVAQDDADPEGHDMSAGLFGPNVSAWLRKVATEYLSKPATPEPVHHASGMTADELWLQVGRLRAQMADAGTKATPEPVLPFLVRDVAALLGASVPDVCKALAHLGHGQRSTNMAIAPYEALEVAAHIRPATTEPVGEPFGWWFTEDPEVFSMPGSGFRRYPNKPQHTVECIPLYTRPAPGVPEVQVAEAVKEAVAAIYFADSSDYKPALWSVVRALSLDLYDTLEKDEQSAYELAVARLAAAQAKGGEQ